MIKNFPSFIRNVNGKIDGMQKWQKPLVPTFEDFCNELTFQPETMIIGSYHGMYDFAKYLNLHVPTTEKTETVELVPGFNAVVNWYSNRRGEIYYLTLMTEFNKEKLIEFFQKLTPFITKLEHYHDMSLCVKD